VSGKEGACLQGKVTLVTGAAQGLGAAIAARFAEEGATVFIADIPAQAETAAKTIAGITTGSGGKVAFIPLDVTDEQSWQNARDAVEKEAGKLDILVNNAGINIRETIEEMPLEHFNKMLAVNVSGAFLGCKYFIPVLRKNGGGAIINMSSQCGLIGHRYTTEAYTVTKGAVTLLTKSVAVRYGKDNIRSNCICPATVNTPMLAERLSDPQFKAERFGEVPLGRLCTADDVANAALFMASDEGAYLNGVALPVDGGSTAD
jgi:NAD(P)-dependent dehydrogenase (short-subunit alcohol dehydrogenase family)